jgi:hypothetical protein
MSTVRHLVQQAVFGLLEWAARQPTQEEAFLPSEIVGNVLQASDGTLIDALESIAIYCEQLGWNGVSRCLFTPVMDGSPCEAVCDESSPSIVSILRGLVRIRNDGAEGHGLMGGYERDAEIDCLHQVAEGMSPILPSVDSDGGLSIGPEGREIKLRFLRLGGGNPILIRTIRRVGRTKLRIDAQYMDKNRRRQSIRFEADNFLESLNAASPPRYDAWNNGWNPLCYVPDRTTETFQGRGDEQRLLASWMDDDDSRTCLIYGDGGVGKTTLVIELLHRFLEEDPDLGVQWKPKFISF